jgi:hypothetical protein
VCAKTALEKENWVWALKKKANQIKVSKGKAQGRV